MKKIFLGSLVVLVVAAACFKDPTPVGNQCNPSAYDSCALQAPASEVNTVQNYLTAHSITNATRHCSGLYYSISDSGTGIRPTVCSTVSVRYVGKLADGSIFDQSSAPVSFNLAQVIYGWRNGLPYLKKGGSMTLYIPATLGYGNRQVGSIPPNSMLIFDVNLVDVQ
ncbi:MAG TPA: FKBP-type peptidyl-prolyl cis-trans isomerase [Chitinophagaceae bacterium]|nr:FKBP-type peptidyl-prolyl cis-trans isomerase [Chitinophagaceae bacterium]